MYPSIKLLHKFNLQALFNKARETNKRPVLKFALDRSEKHGSTILEVNTQ